jgi:hypothetical protein
MLDIPEIQQLLEMTHQTLNHGRQAARDDAWFSSIASMANKNVLLFQPRVNTGSGKTSVFI